MALKLTSPAFEEGEAIPVQYSCHGRNVPPSLVWSGTPTGTAGYTLILEDPDAPVGLFTHWVVFNIPPALNALPEGWTGAGQTASGVEQGRNSAGRAGYFGPCPPPGKPHRYFFRLYAQDQRLVLKPGASREQVLAALKGHTAAAAQLMGTFASPG